MIPRSRVNKLWKAKWERMCQQGPISINMKLEILSLVHKLELKSHLILGLFIFKIPNNKFKMINQKKVHNRLTPV